MRNPAAVACTRPVLAAMLALAVAAPVQAARWFDAPLSTQAMAGYPTRDIPLVHAVGDLDGDGFADAVVPGLYDSLGVYLGLGDGSFGPVRTYSCPPSSAFLAIADFDGDGAQDIAHANWSSAGVEFGDGTGRGWTDVWFMVEGPGGRALVAGDFDEDGRCDFAVPAVGHVEMFLSRPGRTFARSSIPVDSLTESAVVGTRVADMDGDGHADIVVGLGYGNPDLIVLSGRGDGTFTTRCVNAWGGVYGMDVADVTGDGLPDIVSAVEIGIMIEPGLPGRTFGAPIFLPTLAVRARAVAACDATGDDVPDIVFSPGLSNDLDVFPGLGGGAFGSPIVSRVGSPMWPLIVADLDADERPDLVSLVEHELSVFGPGLVSALGAGAGKFGTATQDIATTNASQLTTCNLDQDGWEDLVFLDPSGASQTLGALMGGPGRAFVPGPGVPQALPPGYVQLLEVLDVTGDGEADAVLLAESTHLLILPGQGDGAFAAAIDVALPGTTPGGTLTDVTGDGVPDFVHANGGVVRVLPGLGGGAFGAAIDSPLGTDVGIPRVADLDGDGVLDVACRVSEPGPHWAWSSRLCVSHGLGGGHFAPPTTLIDLHTGADAELGDLNGDGRLDTFTYDYADVPCEPWCIRILVFLQSPGGTLGPAIESPWSTCGLGGWFQVVDVDADGAADLVLSPGYALTVARGDGAGHVVEIGGHTTSGGESSGLTLRDFDHDGRLDAVVSTEEGLSILWGRDPVPPTVALLGPGALPAMVPGAATTIHWGAADNVGVASADLFVSRHGVRGPFERIALGLADTGAHEWTVTGPLSDSVAFKVVVRDSAGNVGRAISADRLRIVDALAVGDAATLPARLAIAAVAPNPSRGRLAVRLALPRPGRVTLALHDLQGRRVATLFDGERPAGESTIDWTSAAASHAPRPGLYFLRVTSGGENALARMVITR